MRYLFEDYLLDTTRRELRREADLVPVEPKVFDLLVYLIANRERVVTKDDLLASVWEGRIVSESALTTRLNAARCAIGDTGEQQRLIKTLPRKGIRFVGAVREDAGQRTAAASDTAPDLAKPVLALPHKPSIAVLPFTNMGGDPEQEYFADGMAEEIITALSCCSWLFVIARNSSFTYKGKSVDVRQIGRDLGVRYVLEGSVRRAANRLRFTGQLVDATSGAHIWADRFEGDLTNVFELQDRMTESVVGAIEPKLQFAEIERLKQKPATSLDAYDLLLRAQQLEYEFSDESYAAAIRCLEQALVIDPTYAPAMAMKAYLYAERRMQGWSRDMGAEAAEGFRLATRAIDLARDDANVLWMAAYAIRQSDPTSARELHRRALHLNPNSVMALIGAAWNEALLSNSPEAIELLRRAERISPRDPRAWVMAAAAANAHLLDGQFKEAVSLAEKALALNPRSTRTLRILAVSLAGLGELEKAANVMRKVLAAEPGLTISSMRIRLAYWPEKAWNRYAELFRLTGLPE